jgi:hypothetical protein
MKGFIGRHVAAVAALLFACNVVFIQAQDNKKMGAVNVTLDMKLNMLELNAETFSDQSLRPGIAQHGKTFAQFGPVDPGSWLTDDAVIKFDYTAERFGGYFKLDKAGLNGVKAWVNIGSLLKVTGGNDIESVYADPLDADPGLRVYGGNTNSTWDSHKNPDNITQDKGLLLEGFWGPITTALAGWVYQANKIVPVPANSEQTEWFDAENREYRYGGRVGCHVGNFGKINASYFMHYRINAESYNVINNNLVPKEANAEIFTHYFGVYASLIPLENIGVTLGYGGIFTKYLDEFEGPTGKVSTLFPAILQNGINLNARYIDIVPGLTLRTDHNFSFWTDKDFTILGGTGFANVGLASQAGTGTAADVNHWLLWNGLGAAYQFSGLVSLEVYVHNLFRSDNAKEPDGKEYNLGKNQIVIEPKVNFHLSPTIKAYAAIVFENTIITASKDLNAAGRYQFKGGSANARDTTDMTNVIKIPVGITMQF